MYKLNIEVITTTNKTLNKSGFGSYSSCTDVVESMQRAGNAVRLTVSEFLPDLHAVVARKPDLVVLAAKFMAVKNAEDVWFSEYFASQHITFSGSDRETLRFDSNKASAKQHLANMRIKTASHFTAMPNQFLSQSALPLDFPLFIKSIDVDNDIGIDESSYVNDFEGFEAKLLSICTQGEQPALVEEYVAGRDFSVAIICSSNGEMTVSAIEVLRQGYTKSDIDCCIPIALSEDQHNVTQLAKAAFLGLGLRDFALIDVRMDHFGQCYFMDADLVPNMTSGSSHFLRACEIASDLSYDQVFCLMLEVFSVRARGDKIHKKVLKQRSQHWPRASVSKLI